MTASTSLEEAAEALVLKVEDILPDLPFHTAKNLEKLIAQMRSFYIVEDEES